ncbi:MAG TPA: tyrosine-type recombinase/integrase [Acidimicrobiia bacterium]
MAHVNKRRTHSGELRYDVRYRGPDDKERSRSFRTRRDADRFRASVEVDLSGQKWIDPNAGKVTLEEYATSWLCARTTLKAQTRTTYEDQLRVHIVPHLGRVELGRLTPRHVREWHSKLIANGLSRNTAAKSYRMLRTILSTAVEDDLITRNPCQIPGAGVERIAERPVATIDQVWAAADAIGERYRCCVLLAGFVGLRLGEIIGLERRHIDLRESTLTVEQQVQELRGRGPVTTTPKSIAGHRTVVLPAFVASELAAHLSRYVGNDPTACMFVGEHGGILRRVVLRKHWLRARTAAGLSDGFRFHDLRHTANTIAASTGASTRELMYRMGHASPQAALRYQHAKRERDAAIATAFEQLAGRPNARTKAAKRAAVSTEVQLEL